jgi:NADPH:quinone reductase-like Zn-dependent oxidoreductase
MGPLQEWTASSALRPVVAARFPLAEGRAAHRYIHARENVGKVVLEP